MKQTPILTKLKVTMNKFYKHIIVPLLLVSVLFSHGSGLAGEEKQPDSLPKRISTHIAHLGKVLPIYMVPGMATLIEIPEAVTGIRLGNPKSVQYVRPDQPENEVTLILRSPNSKPTNLIIRAGKKKYVFDIIPNRKVHQDTLEIIGVAGGPESLDAIPRVLLDSSENEKSGGKAP